MFLYQDIAEPPQEPLLAAYDPSGDLSLYNALPWFPDRTQKPVADNYLYVTTPPDITVNEGYDETVLTVEISSDKRFLYQGKASPPETILEDTYDPSEDPTAWNEKLSDPYMFRSLEGPTGASEQDRRNRRNWFPAFEPEVPSLFTLLDAFELVAWDSAASTSAAASAMGRANAPGGKNNKKGTGQSKISKYGQFAWVLGLSVPWGPGNSPPWGPLGDVPTERIDHFSIISNHNFHRDRPLNLPFEASSAPLFFGPERMKVDWEPPLSLPLFSKPPRPIEQLHFLDDQVEDVISTSWDVPFSVPILPPFVTQDINERFVNLTTEENVTFVDKWDSPLMRLMPVRPRIAISPWPFASTDQPPIPDDIGPDHWWTRWPDPVVTPDWLRLAIGVFDTEPIPDLDLLPTRMPWWTPLSEPVRPAPGAVNTGGEAFVNLTTDETVFIDSYFRSLTNEVPRAPEMAIALFPFRLEPEDTTPEDITLDKWWTELPHNFHRLPPSPLPEMETIGQPEISEEITIDKWYSSTTAYPEYTARALRAVTDPKPQSRHWTVLTAPWVRFASMDPLPIPDIQGVTYAWWFTSLSIPIQLFTQPEENDNLYLRLYLPLQDFPIDTTAGFCENPRRRPSEKTGEC